MCVGASESAWCERERERECVCVFVCECTGTCVSEREKVCVCVMIMNRGDIRRGTVNIGRYAGGEW